MGLAGIRPTLQEAADTWVPGLLARYIPGKVWSNALRLALARRVGSPLVPITGAMGWEALLAVATACGFGLAVFHHWPSPAWRGSAVLVLVITAGVLVVARLALGRGQIPRWISRLGLLAPARGGGGVVMLAAINLVAWICYGASHWALARAIMPVSLAEAPMVAGAVALAWAGGYLVLVMPAGLGVREGLLVLLLGPRFGTGPVVALAAGSRLISVGIDVTLTALWAWWRAAPPASGRPPSAAAATRRLRAAGDSPRSDPPAGR